MFLMIGIEFRSDEFALVRLAQTASLLSSPQVSRTSRSYVLVAIAMVAIFRDPGPCAIEWQTADAVRQAAVARSLIAAVGISPLFQFSTRVACQ